MALDKAHREAEISVHLKDGYEGITELDFAAGNVLAPWALELQLWASYRAQVCGCKRAANLVFLRA